MPQTLARRPLHCRVSTRLPEVNRLRRELKDITPHLFYKLTTLAELCSLLLSSPKIEGPTLLPPAVLIDPQHARKPLVSSPHRARHVGQDPIAFQARSSIFCEVW
jgi:hypothetical protein